MRESRRRISAGILAFVMVAGPGGLLEGCKKQEVSEETRNEARQGKAFDTSKLSENEFKYGVSPTKNSQVTYQPDVIVVEHGADAIKSANSDGVSVTIDANLPEAAQMKTGKIVFLTSRAAGKILATQRDGNNLTLLLGPVALTDIIQDATMATDQPLDLDSMIAYTAPDYPGAVAEAPKLTQAIQPRLGGRGEVRAVGVSLILPDGGFQSLRGTKRALPGDLSEQDSPVIWTDRDVAAVRNLALYGTTHPTAKEISFAQTPKLPGTPGVPPLKGPPQDIQLSDFNLKPFCCGGIGLKIQYDKAGLRFLAYAVIKLDHPSLHFNLDIKGGQIRTAALELKGAAGLTFDFEAGTSMDASATLNNLGKEIALPVDFSIPISGLAVPFAATLKQTFLLKTAFSAKTASLTATADYGFKGSFQMGYINGQWTAAAPMDFSVKKSLVNTIGGASVGVNGIVLAYSGKVIVGIGAFGFVTGPYINYIASVGFTRGSDLGIKMCKSATLSIDLAVGVGYSMPQVINTAINFFLRQLNVGEVAASGGIDHREKLITKEQTIPESCKN
ncbi:MAG: hypothetical protein JSS69_05890 [Acidobacteria bacterium]|nr:hypothetical protein [Acidobacteriota bacterium]MBS1865432.1 hypothetical protein [Acidobacteriota bacterium]